MKHFDENQTDEMRAIKVRHVEERWSQLFELAKDSGDTAFKYLFNTHINAGGAVAVH